MPYNYSFVIPHLLAGMACPGMTLPIEADLLQLKNDGISAVVSLTEYPLPFDAIDEQNIDYLHLPIADFTPPTISQINEFTEFVSKKHNENIGVAVHCAAGVGRTGTMLACYLVYIGETASDAIESIRTIRPGSIETYDQEAIIHKYFKESTSNG